jgi:anthranilate phosphoribosyltransferase
MAGFGGGGARSEPRAIARFGIRHGIVFTTAHHRTTSVNTLSTIDRVQAGENLSRAEMADTIASMVGGQWSDDDAAALLLALRDKGETADEIAGAAEALRCHMTRIHTRRTGLVDTCGTGGDASGTFNISTAAALVASGAGVPVAKHGNRAITSKSGSADVLAELGVNIDAPVAVVERCLDEVGICFCFAPLLHPAMKNVAAVRKKLGVPTIFNLLGPLCNPAGAPFQLLGVGRPNLHRMMAEVLALLGTERSLVVCGSDGLDEVTLGGTTHAIEVTPSGLVEHHWTPHDFGLAACERSALLAEDARSSAKIIRGVLAGKRGAPRDVTVAGAAAALWIAGRDPSLSACARLAEGAIDSGAASHVLDRLAEVSRS